MQPEIQLVKQFDKDGDKRLNAAERKAARQYLADNPRPRCSPIFRPPRFGPVKAILRDDRDRTSWRSPKRLTVGPFPKPGNVPSEPCMDRFW